MGLSRILDKSIYMQNNIDFLYVKNMIPRKDQEKIEKQLSGNKIALLNNVIK